MKTFAPSGAKLDVIPLPEVLHHGLIAPGVIGLLSVASTATLITFLLYRMWQWRKDHRSLADYNQYIFLILNLLLADLLQALSFSLSWYWRSINAIIHTDPVCFTQGWFLNLGDTASGLFVFSIAAHTFYATIKGRRLGPRLFFSLIGITWAFCVLVTALGPIIRGDKYFTQAGAWCWAAAKWETERLLFHYVEVFVVEFGTVLIYLAVFLYLRRSVKHIRKSVHTTTSASIDRAAKLMIIFPIAYVVLTLPLSSGRMWSMAHKGKSLPPSYACIVGSLMASTGLVDALLYTLTRRALVSSSPTGVSKTKSYAVDGDTTLRKSELLTQSGLDGPVIKQSRTFTVVAEVPRPTSTATLPEEVEMSYKETRSRPPMRSYHSHDPTRGSVQRGVLFASLTNYKDSTLQIPGYQAPPMPALPSMAGLNLDVDEKTGSGVIERDRNESTDESTDGKDEKDLV